MKISANMISNALSCEKKFYHRYLAKTPIDVGYEKPDYFIFGSALHKLLELSKWERNNFGMFLDCVIEEYKLDDTEIAKLFTGATKACEYIKSLNHFKLLTEVEFHDEETFYHGKVDLIIIYADNSWDILDLKTAASFDPNKEFILKNNVQVNMYMQNVKKIASICDLEPSKFKNFIYFEVKKSLQRLKKGESLEELAKRLDCDFREIIISESTMDLSQYSKKVIDLMMKDSFCMNIFNCVSFQSPCEYFASCHGKEYQK